MEPTPKRFAELSQRSLIDDANEAGRTAEKYDPDTHRHLIAHVTVSDLGEAGYAVTSTAEAIVHWLHDGQPVTLWKDRRGNITSTPWGNLQPVAVEYFTR